MATAPNLLRVVRDTPEAPEGPEAPEAGHKQDAAREAAVEQAQVAARAKEAASERDKELVERARAGDQRAWGRLYQEHFDRVFRYAVYLVGDADLAEDLTQETFARALVSLSNYRGDAQVRTWINCITINVAREHWRKVKRTNRISEALSRVNLDRTEAEQLHHGYLDGVRSEVLYAVLDELPVHLREAFVVRDLMELTGSEAAAELGISAGNVAVRAHRARLRVRSQLESLGWLDACGKPTSSPNSDGSGNGSADIPKGEGGCT